MSTGQAFILEAETPRLTLARGSAGDVPRDRHGRLHWGGQPGARNAGMTKNNKAAPTAATPSAARLKLARRGSNPGDDLSGLQQRLLEAQATIEHDYKRLRELEARYRHLFDTAEGLLVVDGASLRIVEANGAACAALGVTHAKGDRHRLARPARPALGRPARGDGRGDAAWRPARAACASTRGRAQAAWSSRRRCSGKTVRSCCCCAWRARKTARRGSSAKPAIRTTTLAKTGPATPPVPPTVWC